jgi:gluconate 5-dehydrogenase
MNIRKPFEDFTRDEIEKILDTNLVGLMRLTQIVGRDMIARKKGGKIVNIGSLTSMIGLPYVSIYGASKGAIAQWTRCIAAEWGKYDIQVNCIAPGFIVTDLNREMWQSVELQNWLKGNQPNPRIGTPEDVSGLAVFLSSKQADYITGQVIVVDGGHTESVMWPFVPGK